MKMLKAVTIVVLLSSACTTKSPSLAESDAPLDRYNYLQETDFYGLVRRIVYNFEPSRSAAELAQFSDLVVLGQIVSIAEGRTFLGEASDPNSVKTVVARVVVDEVIRGSVGSDVYVAFWRPT